MSEEIIAIVNEKDEIVDTKKISEVHKHGLIHREAYIYLINFDDEVLLQKRKDNGLWDHSAAGHFCKKESYEKGAIREFKEELGVKIEMSDLIAVSYERLNTIKPDKKNFRFVKIYIVRKDIPLKKFKIDNAEVRDIKFFNKIELQNLLQQPHLLTRSAKLLINKYILNKI